MAAGNTHFLGIEDESTGLADDPWPRVQVQAYQFGVAAILRHVNRYVEKCAGHKEYALPQGRKDDPSFDRAALRAGIAGLAPSDQPHGIRAQVPPAPDGSAGRATPSRGAQGPLISTVQAAVNMSSAAQSSGLRRTLRCVPSSVRTAWCRTASWGRAPGKRWKAHKAARATPREFEVTTEEYTMDIAFGRTTLTVNPSTQADLWQALESNAPFPDRTAAIGNISAQYASGEIPIALGGGANVSLTASFSAGGHSGIGIYTAAADAVASLGLDPSITPNFPAGADDRFLLVSFDATAAVFGD